MEGPKQAPPDALLVLVRHGDTNVNNEHRMRAWVDVELNSIGRRQVVKAAKALEKLPLPVVEIFCSDLTRTEQTAQILANQFFVPLTKKFDLRPWNLGKFTMQKFDAVKERLVQFVKSNEEVPGGERFKQFQRRWKGAFQDLVTAAVARKATVVAVTHSRNIETVRQWLAKTNDPVAHIEAATVEPGGFMTIEIRGRKLSLAPYENSHLQGAVE